VQHSHTIQDEIAYHPNEERPHVETIKVRKQEHKHIYVHNDLSNAAYHFKTVIETKLAANDRNGIAFDYMACLLMLAFTFEAKVNLLGVTTHPSAAV
jgi:hypothetical protein